MIKKRVHNTKPYQAPEPTFTVGKAPCIKRCKRVKCRGKYASAGRGNVAPPINARVMPTQVEIKRK